MKVLKCKIGWLFVVLIFMGQTVSAKEFERNIKKSSPIAMNGQVELSNTRGTIDVRTWDKSEVSIDVLITVNARNIGDANEVFDRIQIKFDSHDNIVNSETIIRDVPKWNCNYVRSEYTVDYIVYMPKKCNLLLSNKYGDALISNLEGKATLSVQHGNIRLQTIGRLLTLDLKYGNCTVVEAANSEIKMIHGNIRLKKADNINFATSYSKINVDLSLIHI